MEKFKKMFGELADCTNSPNIFCNITVFCREDTRPSPTL